MEFILIHRARGLIPPENEKAIVELAKKLIEKPEELVPGGKVIAAYAARCKDLVVCIWDVPKAENLVPAFEQLANLGYDTEIIPAEKWSESISKYEKTLVEALKK